MRMLSPGQRAKLAILRKQAQSNMAASAQPAQPPTTAPMPNPLAAASMAIPGPVFKPKKII